jgi:hypothetical protein
MANLTSGVYTEIYRENFYSEDGGSKMVWITGESLPEHVLSHLSKQ